MEMEKRKKLVAFNQNVSDMLKQISEYTGNTENQIISMAITLLFVKIFKK